jgi:hypothetical protein
MGGHDSQTNESNLDNISHSDTNPDTNLDNISHTNTATTMPSTSPASSSTSLLSRIKRHLGLGTMREKWASSWAPLMAAKSNLDSEYNFPRGRYAGQGQGYNFPSSRAAGEGTPYQRR